MSTVLVPYSYFSQARHTHSTDRQAAPDRQAGRRPLLQAGGPAHYPDVESQPRKLCETDAEVTRAARAASCDEPKQARGATAYGM